MPKNILIFSDGTGQAGGISFDENRSNIYKLYRATRVGPDSKIDPAEQVAFYDPGLGSKADTNAVWAKGALRWVYNLISQATGFGITANIIDCYAAIIRMYEEGDRIFLFGFSRGAYTVRCLGGVLAHCGVPRCLADNKPLKLDADSSLKLAAYAVKHIYQFTESRYLDEVTPRQKFLLETRSLLNKRFRQEHGSKSRDNPDISNVEPYFIGVFDTVAALGNWKKSFLFGIGFVLIALLVSFAAYTLQFFLSFPLLQLLTIKNVFFSILAAAAAMTLAVFFYTHIKFDFRIPEYNWLQRLKTIHLTSVWQTFYDRSLSPQVRYAKHAISIDENRSDFKRVEWGRFDPNRSPRDKNDNPWFEQVWFSGCHSDIGGSYSENESRLSDITLKWMLACASVIPNGTRYDNSVLTLHPGSWGMQHDEQKAGLGFITKLFHVSWGKKDRELPKRSEDTYSRATMHSSVYDRFNLEEVLQYDIRSKYRPATLKNHVDFKDGYNEDGTGNDKPYASDSCVATRTEIKFDALSAPLAK